MNTSGHMVDNNGETAGLEKFINEIASSRKNAIYAASFLGVAYMIKWYFSQADCEQLRWLLYPLSVFSNFLTGMSFSFDSELGYVSHDGAFVIAKSCSGINFFIISFALSAFLLLKNIKRYHFTIIPVALFLAIPFSLVVNTIRIALSIVLFKSHVEFGILNAERIHCMLGVAIYFLSLCLLYRFIEHFPAKCRPDQSIRPFLVPLFWYLAVVLVTPLVNNFKIVYDSTFQVYSLFAVSIPLMLIGVCRILKHFRQ